MTVHARRSIRGLLWSVAAAAAALVLPGASHVEAGGTQDFGINIDVTTLFGSTPSDGYGAASGQAGVWNAFAGSPGGPFNLAGLTGADSGANLTITGDANTRSTCVEGFSSLDYRALICDYHYAVAGVVNHLVWEIDSLPAGTYDVYTYACIPGESFSPAFAIEISVNDVSQGFAFVQGPVLTQFFMEGVTHDIRTVTVPQNGKISVRAFDTSGEFGDPVAINGIQLVRLNDDPTAVISDPTPIECVCGDVAIRGTASVPAGQFLGYKLEWSQTGNDPWTLITNGTSPVTNDVLGTWNTTGLSEGYYLIRLTTQNTNGGTSTAITTAYLNTFFNTVDITSPPNGSIVGGLVCFGGTIWDNCFDSYRVTYYDGQSIAPVDPANPIYTNPVITSTFATWNSATGSTAVPDGTYLITAEGFSDCDISAAQEIEVTVDNTPPVAEITHPDNCDVVCGRVAVRGRISDEHLESWVLQYTGGSTNGWVTIASGTEAVDGRIAFWETEGLEPCCYTLRLLANDSAIVNCLSQPGNQTEFLVSVDVGLASDITGDGAVNFEDLTELLDDWGLMGCPD